MTIEIRDLSLHYPTRDGDKVVAVEDVSIDLADNEFLAVVGPSGCGKTTLLRILAGLLRQTDGSIVQDGLPYEAARDRIGVVFQEARLLPWLTILQNVLVPITVRRGDKAAAKGRAMDLLRMVGIETFANRYPGELSGGMQQRAAICRALINEPKLLLMDEPFGALDAMTRETMNQELRQIWQAAPKTVLFITHSIPEAVFLADRIAVFTPRPGRLHKIIAVDLPESRDLSVMADPRFVALTSECRSMFRSNTNFF